MGQLRESFRGAKTLTVARRGAMQSHRHRLEAVVNAAAMSNGSNAAKIPEIL